PRDGLDDFEGQRSRGVVVKIDTHRESFIVAFPLTLGSERTRQASDGGHILAGLRSFPAPRRAWRPVQGKGGGLRCGNVMKRFGQQVGHPRRRRRLRPVRRLSGKKPLTAWRGKS